ncbi:MAG: hypothetical protein IH600_01210 [Bacteroidetes bacterium]|nr:hypothetical protein [Bacteroidota bacterium]
MNLNTSLFGPRSKYDRSLPYTYVARVRIIDGNSDLTNAFFADTICGLIDYLDTNNIEPREVELCGLYLDREIPLDVKYCIDEQGHWLERPDICHSLEQHYKESLDLQYKGHHEHETCSYDDRERQGSGPY